jgi:glycosyltransferase involved in cell wall biosynthesis
MSELAALTSPFFSVVIPVFNREQLIRLTLASVLTNTYKDFEIIVSDDGSSDNTVEVVRSFGDQVTLIQQTNQGPAIARNHAIQAARGRYIAFLDSDDLWFPWTLANHYRVIENHGFPSAVIGSLVEFNNDTELSHVTEVALDIEPSDSLLHLVQQRGPMCFYTGMLVVRTDVLRATGGFEASRMNCEDIDLVLRLCTAGPALYLANPPSYGLRRGINSISDNVKQSDQGIRRIIAKEQKGLYPGGKFGRSSRRALITFMARGISVRLLYSNARMASAALYQNSFLWNLVLGRWRFLIGFPLLWMGSLLGVKWRSFPREAV